MDLAFTPHRDAGGALHMPSSSHSHSHSHSLTHTHTHNPLTGSVARFSSIDQLRHSLSRSPSKQPSPVPLPAAPASASAAGAYPHHYAEPSSTAPTTANSSASTTPSPSPAYFHPNSPFSSASSFSSPLVPSTTPPVVSRSRLALSSASTAAAAAVSSSSRKPKFHLRRNLPQRVVRLSRPGSLSSPSQPWSPSASLLASSCAAPTPPVSAVDSFFPAHIDLDASIQNNNNNSSSNNNVTTRRSDNNNKNNNNATSANSTITTTGPADNNNLTRPAHDRASPPAFGPKSVGPRSRSLFTAPAASPSSFSRYADLNHNMSSARLEDDGSVLHSERAVFADSRSSNPVAPRSHPHSHSHSHSYSHPLPRSYLHSQLHPHSQPHRHPHSPSSTDVVMSSSLAAAAPLSSPKTPSPTSDDDFDFSLQQPTARTGFSHSHSQSVSIPPSSTFPPAKTSPLKRTDGVVNLDQPNSGSPVPKRRQLQLNSFTSNSLSPPLLSPRSTTQPSGLRPRRNTRAGLQSVPPLSPSANTAESPFMPIDGLANAFPGPRRSPRRAFVLKRPAGSRPPSTRISTGGFGIEHTQNAPFTASYAEPPTFTFNPQLLSRRVPPGPASSIGIAFPPLPPPPFAPPPPVHQSDTQTNTSFPGLDGMSDDIARPSPARRHARTLFSRSLPIGASRPLLMKDKGPGANTISTPAAYKNAKPIPEAFMSTGLISKRNHNVDDSKGSGTSYNMPDTPSKRVSFPPVSSTPFSASVFGRRPPFGLDFDTPGTPSSPSLNQNQQYPDLAGKGVRLFGSQGRRSLTSSQRQTTLFSNLDNDDINPHFSPAPNDGQSSNDELPPTPTKPPGGSSRRSKPNSLRSSLLGRRKSIGPDTFVPPTEPILSLSHSNSPSVSNSPTPGHARLSTPVAGVSTNVNRASPHTPQGRPVQPDFGASVSSNSSSRGPLPATPTAQRDSPAAFGRSRGRSSVVSSVFDNNVDTSITARFGVVVLQGKGEFSNVFRVERPHNVTALGLSSSCQQSGVWAVKKTKRPYVGHRDREAKLREVNILRHLTGNDHIIQYVDSWEANNHLYIQTEYCENGNLKDFLTQAGFKARLDDFRIWKILLELSMGVQHIHSNNFIHLDLKPANVFIDWGGVLKIGDFGLASAWPAPSDIDGEGDREYIGPEVLNGRFDKPADIFALGMVMLEIAGNIVLPDNGASWQRLRTGDLCDLPSLTWSTESSLPRDVSGEPLFLADDDAQGNDNGNCGSGSGSSFGTATGAQDSRNCHSNPNSTPSLRGQHSDSNSTNSSHSSSSTAAKAAAAAAAAAAHRPNELSDPPAFMCDPSHPGTLDRLVQWMISPDPADRPTIGQVFGHEGVQWVAGRRRAGATIYEGNWGPADEVVMMGPNAGSGAVGSGGSDDVDMMDTN